MFLKTSRVLGKYIFSPGMFGFSVFAVKAWCHLFRKKRKEKEKEPENGKLAASGLLMRKGQQHANGGEISFDTFPVFSTK